MDFLENVKNAVGSAAQTVAKKSGEVVEVSKIKYAMYEAKGTIKELKEEIGEAVYTSYKNNTPLDSVVREKCARIDELQSEIDAYDGRLYTYKSMVKCPSCGEKVKDDNKFCPKCGARLAVDKDAEVSGEQEYYTPPQPTRAEEPADEAAPTEEGAKEESPKE